MEPKFQHNYLILLSMLYLTVKLITIVLIYKIIKIGHFSASASTLVIPFWFFLSDIIAEVYGYKISKYLIWTAIACQFIFALVCVVLIHINSPADWPHQQAYQQVLGSLLRVTLASFLAIICGALINIYALTKWKILLRGKHFWLRSLGATALGEAVFTIIAYVTEFAGIAPLQQIIQLIIISYTIKLIFDPILVIPASFVVNHIKKLEKIDISNYSETFNPFKQHLKNSADIAK